MALEYNLQYSTVFEFETVRSYERWGAGKGWMGQYVHWSVYLSVGYLLCIFGIQRFMEHRPAYKLQVLLILWNSFLTLFSVFGAIRAFTELVYVLQTFGVTHSLCSQDYLHRGVIEFWACAFTFSKALELIDTIFVVLRKGRLIFLHWYHHVTVLMFTWYAYVNGIGACRWFMVMNFTVHALMYAYYGLRAANIRVPRQVSVTITTMQILQMMIGMTVSVAELYFLRTGQCAESSKSTLYFAIAMYFSYLILFLNFFYKNYLSPSLSKAKQKKV